MMKLTALQRCIIAMMRGESFEGEYVPGCDRDGEWFWLETIPYFGRAKIDPLVAVGLIEKRGNGSYRLVEPRPSDDLGDLWVE